MFHAIPSAIALRMRELETLDAEQRARSSPSRAWIRALSPDSGRTLALLAALAPPGPLVELGTGAGYATLWLALAAGPRPLITIERDPDKAALARETFALTHVAVDLREGDAAALLPTLGVLALVFMDHGPAHYAEALPLAIEALVPGGLLVVDNITSHREITTPLVDALALDPRVDAVTLPVGKGLLVARRVA